MKTHAGGARFALALLLALSAFARFEPSSAPAMSAANACLLSIRAVRCNGDAASMSGAPQVTASISG